MNLIKRILFIMLNLFIIISPIKVYGNDIEGDIIVKEKTTIKEENNEDSHEKSEKDIEISSNEFTIDNVIYKVIDKDNNYVMFFSYEEPEEEDTLVVPNYISYDGIEYKVEYIHKNAFNKDSSSEQHKCMITKIIISDEVEGFCNDKGRKVQRVSSIFKNQKNLEIIEFGNIDVQWEDCCFYGCRNLKSIKIPENITMLTDMTFYGCSSLEKINLQNIVEFKGGMIFKGCENLESIGGFNDEVRVLPEYMFEDCEKLNISDMNNVIEVGRECFKNCKKLDDTVVDNLEKIGEKSFAGCSNFKTINLKKLSNIGNEAFADCCNLEVIHFLVPTCPDILGRIDKFYNSNISRYVFPEAYKNSMKYDKFLKSLSIRVTFIYSDKKFEESYSNSLGDLFNFNSGYLKLLSWYNDEKLTNKIDRPIDAAVIENGNLIIESPVVFGKYVENLEIGNEEPDKSEYDGDAEESKADNNKESNNDFSQEDNDKENIEDTQNVDKKEEQITNDVIDKDNDQDILDENITDNKKAESIFEDYHENDKAVTESKRKVKRNSSISDQNNNNEENFQVIILEKSKLKYGINKIWLDKKYYSNEKEFYDKVFISIYCDYRSLRDDSINRMAIYYYDYTGAYYEKWIS